MPILLLALTHVALSRPNACIAAFAQVGDTWDQCIENTIKKLAYGAIGGGLAAVILFRESAAPPEASLCTFP